MQPATRSLLLTALLVVSTWPALANWPMKCWTDREGKTTCSDVLPPEASDRPRREYGEDGIPRRELPAAPTEEEIAGQKQLEELRTEAAQIRAEQEAYDKRLLDLYPTIEDLLEKRAGTIAEMDMHIDIAREQVRLQQSRLARLQAIAAQAERNGEQPSPRLVGELAATADAISDLQSAAERRQAEKADRLAELDAQLRRYRELRTDGAAGVQVDNAAAPDPGDTVLTVMACATEAECARLWEKAKAYARRHATTPIDLAADRILATAPPRSVGDIAITVTRQVDSEGGGGRIFMDVQCAELPAAQAFCHGPEVVAIRRHFREELRLHAPD